MLLKIKSVLEFKILPEHAEQKPEIAIFSGSHCLCFWAVMSALYIQHTSKIALVSLGHKHASYELVVLLESTLVIRIHAKLVVPVRTESTTAYYEYIGCEFAAAISLCSIAGRAV